MSNIEIAVRVRPLIEREKKENLEPLWEIKENSIVQSGLSGDPYIFGLTSFVYALLMYIYLIYL